MVDAPHTPSMLEGIAALASALAWPLVAVLFGAIYRKQISEGLSVLIQKLAKAKHMKLGGVELAEELIDEAMSQPSQPIRLTATGSDIQADVPPSQLADAVRLKSELLNAGVQRSEAKVSAREAVSNLAANYEDLRRKMPAGSERTRGMDEIVGKMRTIGLLVKPLLPMLTRSQVAGERLAAIASLQIEPDYTYLDWLGERFSTEYPFVFYHAAIALRQFSLDVPESKRSVLLAKIKAAQRTLNSFSEGRPDAGTLAVLEQAIATLEPPF